MARAAGRRRHVRRRARRRPARAGRAADRSTSSTTIPSLTFRRSGRIVPHRAHGIVHRLPRPRRIRRGTCSTSRTTRLPLVEPAATCIVETSRGCPYSCDFCVAPIHQGHKFREKSAEGARRRNGARLSRVRPEVLLSVGRHGHAEREDVQRVLRRAHRAQAAGAVVRQRARRQPQRPGVRASACARRAAGCWRSASRPNPKRRART